MYDVFGERKGDRFSLDYMLHRWCCAFFRRDTDSFVAEFYHQSKGAAPNDNKSMGDWEPNFDQPLRLLVLSSDRHVAPYFSVMVVLWAMDDEFVREANGSYYYDSRLRIKMVLIHEVSRVEPFYGILIPG